MMDYAKLRKVILSADSNAQKTSADQYRKLFFAKLHRLHESAEVKERFVTAMQLTYLFVCFVTVVIIAL